jgi:hypothetical protein
LQAAQTNFSFDPHCSQNIASEGLSVLQDKHSIVLGAQFLDQCLGVLEIGGVETLGEPVDNPLKFNAFY